MTSAVMVSEYKAAVKVTSFEVGLIALDLSRYANFLQDWEKAASGSSLPAVSSPERVISPMVTRIAHKHRLQLLNQMFSIQPPVGGQGPRLILNIDPALSFDEYVDPEQ